MIEIDSIGAEGIGDEDSDSLSEDEREDDSDSFREEDNEVKSKSGSRWGLVISDSDAERERRLGVEEVGDAVMEAIYGVLDLGLWLFD